MKNIYLGEGVYGERFLSFHQLPALIKVRVENQELYNRLSTTDILAKWLEPLADVTKVADCFDAMHHLQFPTSRFYSDVSPMDLNNIINTTITKLDENQSTLLVILRKDIYKPNEVLNNVNARLNMLGSCYSETSVFKVIDVTLDEGNPDIDLFESETGELCLLYDEVVTVFRKGDSAKWGSPE